MNKSELERAFVSEKGLTKDQKTFQDRIKVIKQLKIDFEKLEVDIEVAKSELKKNIFPLEIQHISLLKTRLNILEDAYLSQKLSKRHKKGLKEVILNECKALLAIDNDEKVMQIFNRFNDQSFEEYVEERDEVYEKFNDIFGDIFEDLPNTENENEEPKKTKKQKERELREKEKEEAKKRTFKDIFRDLIKIFHPDKERDEHKKLEKEEVTKQITKAYKDNDLLALLEMEISLLKSNNERVKQLAADKLKLYNEILLSQKQKLELQLYVLKSENEFVYRKMCYKNADKGKFISQMKNEWKYKIKILGLENKDLMSSKDFLKSFIEIYQEDMETNNMFPF